MAIGRLHAGIAEIDITPQIGTELAGEFNPRTARGIRTPLTAKAMVVSNNEETLAIVTLDLFGLEPITAATIIKTTSEKCGIKPESLMVVCSRTRGGPYTVPVIGYPGINETYLNELAGKIPDLVQQALAEIQPASLGVGHAKLPHLVYNHRLMTRNMKAISAWIGVPPNEVLEPEGPVDPEFTTIVLRDNHGFPIAFLWNFSADNRFSTGDQISADLPGEVQKELDARLGRHIPTLYLGGCGGNVSYIHDLANTTQVVASGVMAVQLETPCDPMIRLGCAVEEMILPIRDYSKLWSQADIELKYPQALEAYQQEIKTLQQEGAQAIPASIQVFRLGQFTLVGLPGAPFVEFALEIKQASPAKATLTAGNAGGDIGLVITRPAFEHAGYETWTARSAKAGPGSGEFMVAEATGLLKRLWRS